MKAETGGSAPGSVIGQPASVLAFRRETPRLDPEGYRHHARRPQTSPRSATGPVDLLSDATPPLDDLLPHNDFLMQLRREKRRVERSKAPLSIVLYRMSDAAAREFDRVLEILHTLKRETDLLGLVGNGMVAVLCPDTDAEGVKAFVRKIEAHTRDLSATSVAATYPDHLFHHLAENGPDPSLPPAMLDDAPGTVARDYPLKRPIDVLGATVALCLFAPVMLAVAISIGLTSPGPVIFKQMRVGRGGSPFAFYKFRSMVANGDDGIHRKFVADLINAEKSTAPPADTAPADGQERVYKLKSDPRVTPIGRFIRKTSIDELPQLFNVLKGDMSLVGPRPPIPYETANYQAWHLRRVLTVKPGITGLWQVEGRSRVTFNDMVRMDLRYIRNRSLGMDLRILLKTIRVVLRGEGAT